MSEVFKFKSQASMAVPDLSDIKGFGKAWNEGERLDYLIEKNHDANGSPVEEDLQGGQEESRRAHNPKNADSNSAPATNYFAPQSSIIRVGDDVAIKVIVQTSLRDEVLLEELRTKAQSIVEQLELHLQERLVEQSGDMSRDPTPHSQ